MNDPLERLALRAREEPFFLAWLLEAFAHSERLDDAGLAAAVGCPLTELNMVRLCRAPREGHEEFWEDVGRVAECYGADASKLALAAKRGRVLRRLQPGQAGEAAPGLLMAARDSDEPPPSPEPPEAP